MAVRNIIQIDEELCDGCGLCVPACAEGALQIIDGKARLVKDSYCDGFGTCLGECPQGAIEIIEREADEYDETAVEKHLSAQKKQERPKLPVQQPVTACPGSAMRQLQARPPIAAPQAGGQASALGHWPVQLMLVPPHAPFLKNANLLICADCVPFAVPDFHSRWLAGKAVVVGCPKLDNLQHYLEKLIDLYNEAQPASVTVLKMEVPCCHGIAQAAEIAADRSNARFTLHVHTISIDGQLLTSDETAIGEREGTHG